MIDFSGDCSITAAMRKCRGFLFAALLAACAPVPGPPVIGAWSGDPPGPDSSTEQPVSLTLYGTPGATAGRYEIGTLTRLSDTDAIGTRQDVWTGRWTLETATDNGQPRQIVYLHDAPSSDINQYAIGPGNTLQPTSAYLHRNLTSREIKIFTLHPSRNAGAP